MKGFSRPKYCPFKRIKAMDRMSDFHNMMAIDLAVEYFSFFSEQGEVRKISAVLGTPGTIRIYHPLLEPCLTPPELSFILHHNGWVGRPLRQCDSETAQPKSNFL